MVSLLTQDGWTVIHWAAWNNRKTLLDQLLLVGGQCCGLTVDIDDNGGRTPLWFAASGGYVDCVDVLLAHGANSDHKR